MKGMNIIMPFYDLRCSKCENEFKANASMSERAENKITCPECGSRKLEAVFRSAPAYIKSRKAPECPNRSVCGSSCSSY